jgi:serine protease Do
VVAIGTPLEEKLFETMTSGIISHKIRRFKEDETKYFQTDATIHPGNSGGPLIDSRGRVIAINTLKAKKETGVNFSVKINEAKEMLARNKVP